MTLLDHADQLDAKVGRDEVSPPSSLEIDAIAERLRADFATELPGDFVQATLREILYENPRGSALVIEQAARIRLRVRAYNAAAPIRRR